MTSQGINGKQVTEMQVVNMAGNTPQIGNAIGRMVRSDRASETVIRSTTGQKDQYQEQEQQFFNHKKYVP